VLGTVKSLPVIFPINSFVLRITDAVAVYLFLRVPEFASLYLWCLLHANSIIGICFFVGVVLFLDLRLFSDGSDASSLTDVAYAPEEAPCQLHVTIIDDDYYDSLVRVSGGVFHTEGGIAEVAEVSSGPIFISSHASQ
jgi:hypothetical protein